MKVFVASMICVLGLFFVAPPMHMAAAQSNNASLSGLAADTSGAILPSVTITAENTQTGIVTSGVTNESGAYSLPSLQPGTYQVRAELPGFQTRVYNNVALEVAAQVRLNFSMSIATLSQTV